MLRNHVGVLRLLLVVKLLAGLSGAWDARPADEEAEIQRRLSLQFRQKIAPWQMP